MKEHDEPQSAPVVFNASQIRKELAGISHLLQSELSDIMYYQCYAAQQALEWVLNSELMASPLAIVTKDIQPPPLAEREQLWQHYPALKDGLCTFGQAQ